MSYNSTKNKKRNENYNQKELMAEDNFFVFDFNKIISIGFFLNKDDKNWIYKSGPIEVFKQTMELFHEIFMEHLKDSKKNNFLAKGEFPPKDHFRHESFKKRELFRFGSLIVWATTLEHIIKRNYKNLQNFYNKIGLNKIRLKQKLKERKLEIKNFEDYRNKVFCHSAYAEPRFEDTNSSKATSLLYFSLNGYAIDKNGDIIFGSTKISSGNGEKNLDVPTLTFKQLCEIFHNHYREWLNMFKIILDATNKISTKNFDKYFQSEGIILKSIAKSDGSRIKIRE